MTILPPNVAPLKSWRSLKAFRAREQTFADNKTGAFARALFRYTETGVIHNALTQAPAEIDPTLRPIPPSEHAYLTSGVSLYAHALLAAQQLSDESPESCPGWFTAVLAKELHSVLEFKIEADFPARFGRTLGMMSIEDAGWVGLAAGIGAVEALDRWAPLLVEAVRRDYVLEDKYCGMHHFILRLWCASRGLDYPGKGYPTYEVAEGVLRMWNTEDTETLGAWLVQLCNQHTQLSRAKQFMDFCNTFSHIPVEILMLFRLRELRGLPNPEVDHPLMKFPWSRLQPVQTAQPDELLQGIYRRLEQDEGITVEGLYRSLLAA
jgi:hypothetical protein